MAWFSKKQPVAVVDQQAEQKVVHGPRLAVLQPDIAGISTFLFSLQDNAADAEQAVSGLRADVRRGTHAFWAMHDRPAASESLHVEALVLIRAKADADLVYVVSFLDLESALSFTRFELRRGLYIGNVMIYWAAFTQIREEIEGVTILPNVAPPSEDKWLGPDPRLAPPLPAPQATVQIAEPVAEPRPKQETIAEAEARQAVERYLEQNPEKSAVPIAEEPPVIEESVAVIEPPVIEQLPEPVIEKLPIFDDEPVTEEAAVADALVLQHPPVVELERIAEAAPEPVAEVAAPETEVDEPEREFIYKRRPAPFTAKRRWSAREARQRAEAEALEAASDVIAEPTTELVAEAFQPRTDATLEPLIVEINAPEIVAAEPEVITAEAPLTEAEAEHQALEAIAERVASYAGDEEIASEPPIEIEATSSAQLIDPANGLPQAEKYSEFDIALEVERLLKNRKWESREGPFRGFKSPPGRF